MIDIVRIRENPAAIQALIDRRHDGTTLGDILDYDKRRREILVEVEALRRERKVSSKAIGRAMGALKQLEKQLKQATANGDDVAALQAEVETKRAAAEAAKDAPRQIGERITTLDDELRTVEATLRDKLLWLPNLPHPTVPDGADESANLHHEPRGTAEPSFDFEPQPHWDLGPELGIIDFERGVKLSGSRFYILKSWGARLQRALIQFMLNFHVERHGYTEIYPPFIVRSENFVGAGQLPKFRDNIYRDAEEDFMLLGTAEIALTNLHRDEILTAAELPINYVAYTPCWRRERMSAGRDVRGIKRGHQFDKVEMYKFTTPDKSYDELEALLQDALDICDALGLRYRIVELAAGDLGFAATKTYDIETWAPGAQEWLEISSVSNCEDFQARRANVRFRPAGGGKTQFAHTLNGSGLALPRVMIAVMENNQQADGSIRIPEVLRPYMGGADLIPAP